MIRVLLIILVLLGAVLAGLYFTIFQNNNETLENIAITNLAGEVVMSETLYDEDAVISYFSAECSSCSQTMKLLETARNAKNPEYSNLKFNYVYFGDDAVAAKAVTEPLGIPEELVFLDEDAAFMQSFGGRSLPTTLFVEAGGRIGLRRTAIQNANYLIVSLKKFQR